MLNKEEKALPARQFVQTMIIHFNPDTEVLPYIVPLTGGTISISMSVIVCLAAMLVIIYIYAKDNSDCPFPST